MADEFIELNQLPSEGRKKKASEFFARMKRGYAKAKELAKDYKQKQEQKKFSRGIDREQAMERATIKAEREVKFANVQARRIAAQKRVYELAAARNKARGQYFGQTAKGFNPFPIDMGIHPVQQPITRDIYRQAPKKKGKAKRRIGYAQAQPQLSLDAELVKFMRR